MKQYLLPLIMITLLFTGSATSTKAQKPAQAITQTILALDSLFWTTYNQCDSERMKQFISDDVEFYHDKGGITLGKEKFISSIKNNLCSNKEYRVRREAVKGTIHVYPLYNADQAYGAIISGDHYFYEHEKGKKEQLAGLAKFSNLWLLQNGTWRMARVLSYDHGPAPLPQLQKRP
ncbi:nuclear transport factor 2 family protein [Rufibacter ruber]|uniref:nuclear transport factor 2 family protein n=1 Tax=Rufibacter ruber TaxID=1783499 RepID=UPI00082F0DFD|nr:nuclear transport factor 2 family protein [Rufibacter ruber]